LITTVSPTEEQTALAKKKAKDMGSIKNSITKGEGNVSGFISEIVVSEVFNARYTPCKDYDLVLPTGETIDVKAKRTTVYPKDYYECSIAKTSLHQKCDMYFFTRYDERNNLLYLLGGVYQDDFFKKAKFLKKGQKDGDNGFIVKADCYNLAIKDL
jgi:hypothetical protein|tara:strand:+ start:2033 stop:2500 length:468 start_codon:yes stop_codon:yes gene_type:complete